MMPLWQPQELGVNIIEMSEYYLLLEEYGLRPLPLKPPSEEDLKVLAALAGSSSSEQAASNLGVSERELGVRTGMLKEAGYLAGTH